MVHSLFCNDLNTPHHNRFLLRQYMKDSLPTLDQEAEYKRIIEENESQGWYRFRMKLIDINRITKVTRQGRIQRYSAMVLVGNGEVWK